MEKALAVEKGGKVKKRKEKKARNEGFIAGQSVLVLDHELGKTDLSQNDSTLNDTPL